MSDSPDLLKGSIRIYIMARHGRAPSKEEVQELANEWNKNSRMSLKDFMRMKGL